MRYLVNLSYNGSIFYGYQIQKNKLTVEGEIERVLSKILNTNINTIAASRTDKGVHANNQYCHFDYDKKINTKQLTHSMNSMINDGIYIKKIKQVDDKFHSRYDVIKKQYGGNLTWKKMESDSSDSSDSISYTKKSVTHGKKAIVKFTCESGKKITIQGKNTLAKNKSYVTIKNGKTAKVTFSKKAPKGSYRFLVKTVSGYKKTITLKVK